MPNESFRSGISRHVRPYGVRLLVYLVLLLHEEMDETAKNDALNILSSINHQNRLFQPER